MQITIMFMAEPAAYASEALDASVSYDPLCGWQLVAQGGEVLRHLHRDQVRDLTCDPANGFVPSASERARPDHRRRQNRRAPST